ncbi:MAG: IS66 family transposase [Desulfobacterales bacterium]|jgi:transposase|nr:IS66 family transposase [Desulfobacteraceae bacterium]MDD3993513.1 IS66 family transposase [Desulfobacteraceae bacterium]MDY0312349.1 IS66 family transposase [Desulfobacterales bacterium]
MNLDVKSLPEDPAQLKEIIVSLFNESAEYRRRIDHLEEMVQLLKNEIFGRTSEKRSVVDSRQFLLFDEDQDDKPQIKDQSTDRQQVAGHSRKKPVRKPLPAELPRVEIIHDLDEAEKSCPCGCQLSRIGEEVCEKLRYTPATLVVERHIRPKYACKQCEGVEDDGPTVKIAPVPPQLIPKSFATGSLIAHIVCAKFEDALPLYRQEKIFARLGIDLSRQTMCGWLINVADQTRPLMDLMDQENRSGPFVNVDETTVQVMKEPDKANTSKSYMWLFRGGQPERPVLVFEYHPSRSGQIPLEYLRGYRGYVQCDAYSGYDALGRQEGIVLVGCWAHARRKFDEVIKARGGTKRRGSAEEALEYIGRLYAMEKRAREAGLDPDALGELRQREAKPVLDEFKVWLDAKVLVTPPKGLLGKAVAYTLNNWQRLIVYLQDGRLRPDNNLAENAIRPFVVGRKNWLFAGNPDGARAAAVYYSLIETAKANGWKAHDYLTHLFENLPLAKTEEDYRKLLPNRSPQ